MRKFIISGIVILVLIVSGAFLYQAVTGSYNNLVELSENTDKAWSQVENVYQRRSDLIPSLVSTVKGEANFEKSTLTDVIDARASASKVVIDSKNLTPEKLAQFNDMQGGLSQALGRLMMVTENYPTLQANGSFRSLMTQLEGTENRITVERKEFNDVAVIYNKEIKKWPGNLTAWFFEFKEKPYFKMDEKAKTAPVVDFETKK